MLYFFSKRKERKFMKDIKIIALDMDGVVNSVKLCQKWIENRTKIEKNNFPNLDDNKISP